MNMSKVAATILLCIWIFLGSAQGQIFTTSSLNSSTCKLILDWVDENTMVFITVDDVLLMPNYQMFSYNNNPYRTFIDDITSRAKDSNGYKNLLENWYKQRKVKLVEPEWPDIIEQLKAKGAKVFAVCEMMLPMKDIEKKRFIEIRGRGLNFTDKVNDKNIIVLGNLDDWMSVFYQGILFSGPLGKAKTIENFMKLTNTVPKKTLFFAMQENTVRQVEQMLSPFDMDFYSVIYLASRNYRPEINPTLIRFQQMEFIETGMLIEDGELLEELTKKEQTLLRNVKK